jgi:polyisoprenoid-binding protein YceI
MTYPKSLLTILLAGIALQSAVSLAQPVTFKVLGTSKDLVSFNSDAPVEVITGNTHKVNGEIKLDDSFKLDAKHPFKIHFTVDLASVDTGIPLRNEHMRDNFLETNKYPQASFNAKSVKFSKTPDLTKAQTVKLDATGDFTLHGVTVQKTIPLMVDYMPGRNKKPGSVRIRGKFPVALEQHKIDRPEAVFVKLAETVFVTVDLTGRAQ